MLNIGDPKLLAVLRDLPSGYLLDMLADNEGIDVSCIYRVLNERGFSKDDIEKRVRRRCQKRFPRRSTLWCIARWISLINAGIVAIYDLLGFNHLMTSAGTFQLPFMFLTLLSAGFGFFLGFKFNTYFYQGSRHQLYCGFPIPIGYVNLETGEETTATSSKLVLIMGCNATVGVVFTIFPIILISQIVLN